ncbi:diaminopimelate decarboxylase [Bartonella tamiae]|uniref:Diaminopimelate decarboxylase n=1 Tax=Bartonella tamiae Th239 TaxID=1094558 RepID=J0ZQR4_9HYPH|nr:diaminopimelate decarboxylase [Bartonella tamiae]EJF90998.1 diaminopimelate decarboxylase [Bartonella tamiae Th239]EJF93337.1 diaminopimelate decarboxylase [Bartonella tamiae Th307]
MTEAFVYCKGILHAENVSLPLIAQQVGTPFYCYSTRYINEQFALYRDAFSTQRAMIAYALKANSNQAILTLLANQGAGADVVSKGELMRALQAGIPAKRIVYSGVGKTTEEIDFALSNDICSFNVESEPELEHLSARSVALGKTARISLRINPDVDAKTHKKIATGKSENKFGIPIKNASQTYQHALQLPGLSVQGVDVHIGSQISELQPFDDAFTIVADFVRHLRADGILIEHVDVGGGLGIQYRHDNHILPSVEEYARIVKKHFDPLNVEIILEPGRNIVGNAGILVSSVIYFKKGEGKNFVIVDAAMNDLIRPTLYDAWQDIMPIKEAVIGVESVVADIVGPVCETGDYLGLERSLPLLHSDDLIAILGAGAYGAVLANTYNTRRLIPEVLVNDDKFAVIRERPDYQSIIDLDHVPDFVYKF